MFGQAKKDFDYLASVKSVRGPRNPGESMVMSEMRMPEADVDPVFQTHYPDVINDEPTIEANSILVDTLNKPCPLCGDLGTGNFSSPGVANELTIHFNELQTAIINTAVAALARLYKNEEIKEHPALGVLDICRLFLGTGPAPEMQVFQANQTPKTERSRHKEGVPWVDVIQVEATRVDDNSTTPDATKHQPSLDDGLDMMYEDTSKGDLYVSTDSSED